MNELKPEGDSKKFQDVLREEVKKCPLIPVQNGFETPQETKRVRGNFDDLLSGDLFGELCLHTDERRLRNELDSLDIEYIDYSELRKRINEISDDLSLEERANLINRLVETDSIEGKTPPKLLINGEEETIQPKSTVFLPPEGEEISLPDWVPQRILHPKLTSLLREKFEVSRIRDLRLKLEDFKVSEYNLASLVQSIVAETNRRVEKEEKGELQWRKEMLQALWNLYSSRGENVTLPGDISIPLPTRNGDFRKADSLYLGEGYPNCKILEELYGPVESNLFVISPEELKFCEEPEKIEEFLCWLGVAKKPRHVEKEVNNSGYLNYVLNSLQFPAKFGNLTLDNARKVKYSSHRLKVQSIDKLEEIIEKSDPHAIICYLATISGELDSWRREGDEDAVLKVKPANKINWRSLKGQEIPSYPLWLLENEDWLPVENGSSRQVPKVCSIAKEVKDLSPVVGYPAVDMSHSLIEEERLDKTLVSTTLRKVGVSNTLEELSWDSFYKILLELPSLDPEGEKARHLYRVLIENKKGSPSSEKHEEFLEKGKMLGEFDGEKSYYPVDELYYLENATLPETIISQYPILELGERRGAAQVKKIFGVERLSMDKVSIRNPEFKEHPLSKEFKSELERLKPLVYALRVDKDQKFTERNRIRELEVILCKSFEANASVGDKEFEIKLENGKFITEGSKVFLVYEPEEFEKNILKDERLASLVGDIFSSVLNVDISDKTYILAQSDNRENALRFTEGIGEEALNKARKYLQGKEDSEITFVAPEPTPVEEKETEEEKKEEREERERGVESEEEQKGEKEIESVKIREKEMPVSEKRNIEIRRVTKRSETPTSTGPRKRADADLAEKISLKFEEENNRSPIPVSHIQGGGAYGCDIISFETESKMNKFKDEANPEMIDRFIEVK
ncbi:hypothetical protein AKJ65_05230 [candidate division MSBL1 archaeon SCGC-AAA259E19]|uniref:Uncharacterized protein n=1 Tax=candidate division MSBL1 archaeon SCGC-AAA259E19 TaxID=1698264 RepID=A0A133UIX2_9EURY|nr:hypothetical protein AKJ65_05230 [candidate division MSBL1 archaeon SCGC-AAA259E19]